MPLISAAALLRKRRAAGATEAVQQDVFGAVGSGDGGILVEDPYDAVYAAVWKRKYEQRKASSGTSGSQQQPGPHIVSHGVAASLPSSDPPPRTASTWTSPFARIGHFLSANLVVCLKGPWVTENYMAIMPDSDVYDRLVVQWQAFQLI